MMGDKLPEAERPPIETLERLLHISADRRERFDVDLQNDCACSSELYDVDTSWTPFGCVGKRTHLDNKIHPSRPAGSNLPSCSVQGCKGEPD